MSHVNDIEWLMLQNRIARLEKVNAKALAQLDADEQRARDAAAAKDAPQPEKK